MYEITKKMTEVLGILIQIHKSISKKISLSNKDENLAIYVLTGKILTNYHAAILLMQYGFIGEAGIVVRSIHESIHVIEYLHTKRDNKDLTKWFNDEIIRPKTARKKMAKLFERIMKKKDKEFERMVSELYSAFSKYVHPTFNISKINMKKDSCEFDYNCSTVRNLYSQYPFSLAQCLVAIVHTFIRVYDIFEINNNDLIKLTQQAKILLNETSA